MLLITPPKIFYSVSIILLSCNIQLASSLIDRSLKISIHLGTKCIIDIYILSIQQFKIFCINNPNDNVNTSLKSHKTTLPNRLYEIWQLMHKRIRLFKMKFMIIFFLHDEIKWNCSGHLRDLACHSFVYSRFQCAAGGILDL